MLWRVPAGRHEWAGLVVTHLQPGDEGARSTRPQCRGTPRSSGWRSKR